MFSGGFARGRIEAVLAMNAVEIVPIADEHIESFHRALDFVARERRYLSFLEAPPLEAARAFVLDMIKHGRFMLTVACWGWVCCRRSADKASASD